MRYPIHNKKAYLCLLIVDTFLASIFFWKKKKELTPPQKILICNSAHLGDIILSTALLPLLKNAFPNAILGMIHRECCLVRASICRVVRHGWKE